MSALRIEVGVEGHDQIRLQENNNKYHINFNGCLEFSQLMINYKNKFGLDVRAWPIPSGKSHSEMVVREFLMKLKGTWSFPYVDEEICHCRHVKTKTVDLAVLKGAHDHELAMQWTGCSTACGTCKPNVQSIIDYRLNKSTRE